MPKFYVSLDFNNRVFSETGKTIYEAFDKLAKPQIIKTKGTMTIKHQDKTETIMLPPFRVKRFVISKNFRKIFAKRVLRLLGIQPNL